MWGTQNPPPKIHNYCCFYGGPFKHAYKWRRLHLVEQFVHCKPIFLFTEYNCWWENIQKVTTSGKVKVSKCSCISISIWTATSSLEPKHILKGCLTTRTQCSMCQTSIFDTQGRKQEHEKYKLHKARPFAHLRLSGNLPFNFYWCVWTDQQT